MLRSTGQWQGNRTPDNQAANKLVDAGGSWFEDVGSTPTASIFMRMVVYRLQFGKEAVSRLLLNAPIVTGDTVLVGVGQHAKREINCVVGVHSFAKLL